VVWVDSEQQRIVQPTTETISRQGAEKVCVIERY
jgi:hypothetical protein